MDDRPWRPHGEGVRLAIRLTPRASRNGVDGVVRDAEGRPALQLRLPAPPVEGAANKALVAFVAKDKQGPCLLVFELEDGVWRLTDFGGDLGDIRRELGR
jgi:uncharacterized protein YggU (UPF0235/DUF167 family)